MIKAFLEKIFSIFKKKKDKTTYEREPIIPDHRKEKLLINKRKENVETLKQAHEEKKHEKVVVETINEKISDVKLKDLDFEEENSALLKIDGIYNIGPTIMLTGFVEHGRLKKGMKSIINEVNMNVSEIRKDREIVPFLNAGEEGTIEIKAKKNPLLRQGDFLEFE